MIKYIISFITWHAFFLFPLFSVAKNNILVLSGGDNPGLNHHSQYLQTRTIYEFLAEKYGQENTDVYFGIGNHNKTITPYPDVHKIELKNGVKVDYVIPGIIANNQEASKSNLLKYFTQKATTLSAHDNLFLFISDHGMPNYLLDSSGRDFSNNCINLWHFNRELINNFQGETNFSKICFSKNEFSDLLSKLSVNHIIFEMSQCYSGGFHQLSVTTKDGYPIANPKICGFTATTPEHLASGCTPDANGPTYQGYERSFTEHFVGKSIPTGNQIRPPAQSMLTAHQAAILEDMTGDIPITTSNYYLLQWADLFESKDFQSRISNKPEKNIKKIFYNYKKFMEINQNPNFIQFNQLLNEFEKKVSLNYSRHTRFFKLSLLEQGRYIAKLETDVAAYKQKMEQEREQAVSLYKHMIFPVWSAAIAKHHVPLGSMEYDMENNLYIPTMDPSKNLFHGNYIPEDMLFIQYLSINNSTEGLFNYHKKRNQIIAQWLNAQGLTDIADAAIYFNDWSKKSEKDLEIYFSLDQEKQLLKRVYLYRKIIAAWITLQKINDVHALEDIENLLQCEHEGI